jgi:hypothetical protein
MAHVADPPPYDGLNLPIAGAEEGDPPLVRLVKKLYAGPASVDHIPTFNGTLDLFPRAHEDGILREPWVTGGVSTRACLMGDSCVGMSPKLAGHEVRGLRPLGPPPRLTRVCRRAVG